MKYFLRLPATVALAQLAGVTIASAQQQQMSPQQLFTPVQQDYAITVLRQVFGPIVDSVMGTTASGSGSGISTAVTTAIGTLNIGLLFLGSVVAAYTLYTAISDTARDGEIFGSAMDTKYTFLRAGVGAALLLPVSGGFSVVQVILLWLLASGSGLGDTMWSQMANALSPLSSSFVTPVYDQYNNYVMRARFSKAFQAHMLSHLCMLEANRIANTVQATGTPISGSNTSKDMTLISGTTAKVQTWTYIGGTAFKNRQDICGNVELLNNIESGNGSVASGVFNVDQYTSAVKVATSNAALQASTNAMQTIIPTAETLAQYIFDGTQYYDTYIQSIFAILDQTMQQYNADLTSSVASANIGATSSQIITQATQNGWMFAPMWQRILSIMSQNVTEAKNSPVMEQVSGTFEMALDANGVQQPGSSTWFSWIWSSRAISQALFDQTKSDFDFANSLGLAFDDAGRPSQTSLETVTTGNGYFTSFIASTYKSIVSTLPGGNGASGWVDPIVSMQKASSYFNDAGTAVAGIGVAKEVLSTAAKFVPGAGRFIGGFVDASFGPVLSAATWFFFAATFILGVVIPFLPIGYFLSGAVAWVIMAIEAVVAGPLWVLLMLAPSRENDFIGTNRQGLLLLIGVFLRPGLMVLGLVACYVVMWVGLNITGLFFSALYGASSVQSVVIMIGLLAMYVLTALVVVMNCAGLITQLGDAIMDWVGVRVSQLGRNNIGEGIAGAVDPIRSVRSLPTIAGGAAGGALTEGRKLIASRYRDRQAKLQPPAGTIQ